MSRFVQALESRTLLTATNTSLAAELTTVNTNAAAVKADLATLTATAKADMKAITTDLKGSAKTNVPLLKKLQSDENKWLTKIKNHTNALLRAASLSAKGVADGDAFLAAPTKLSLQSKIVGDVNALNVATTAPLAALTADIPSATISADITALTTANPTNTTLANDTSRITSDLLETQLGPGVSQSILVTVSGQLVNDAGKFSMAVSALTTDLATLEPAPTTTPSLVGDYKGTLKTKGVIFGIGATKVSFELDITSQTLDSVEGKIIVDGQTASGTITSRELTNGKVNLTLDDSGVTITLNGKVNVTPTATGLAPGSVISGSGSISIAGFSIDGDFSATKTT